MKRIFIFLCCILIYLPTYSFSINIKLLTGKTILLSVQSTDQIENIKAKVQDKEGIPPDQQAYSFEGKILDNDKTLFEYHITDGSLLHQMLSSIIHPSSNILYVYQNVSGGNGSGDSWTNALPELADALMWAHQQYEHNPDWLNGDSLRIFVAKGTYQPLYSPEDGKFGNDDGRNNTFLMVKNVQIYGSFAGTEASLSERDLSLTANASTLSGDIGTVNDSSDNAYHVIVSAGDVGTACLDGFTISGGNADGSSNISINSHKIEQYSGGGMYNESSSPSITNSSFENNKVSVSGGGMDNTRSSPSITNSSFENNTAGYDGGGMYNRVFSSPSLTNVTISGNTANAGSGIYSINNSSPQIQNSIIYGNNSGIDKDGSSSYDISYSLVQGLTDTTNGNIPATDPQFVDTTHHNYQLKITSPAINAGSNVAYTNAGGDVANDSDLAGHARVYDEANRGVIDMGAYEYQGNPIDYSNIGFDDSTVTYDGTDRQFEITHTPDSIATVAYTLKDSTGTTVTEAKNVGKYTIQAALKIADGTVGLDTTVTLNIRKAAILGISFKSDTVTYDGNNHNLSIAGTLPTGASVRYSNPMTDVGIYTDTAFIDGGNNYKKDTLTAKLKITKATLSVTANTGQNKVYGETDPAFTFSASGFQNGDDSASVFTGALSRVSGEDVGNYAIQIGTLSAGDNYTVDFTGKDFEITKATLSVTANTNQSKVYGEADPVLSFSASGFQNGDDSVSVFTGALSRAIGEDVGNYAIQIGTLNAGDNYTLDFTGDNFEITKATLSVTANADQSKVYGETDPAFTFSATGFQNGDDSASVFTGTLSRVSGEDVGSYAIQIGSLSAGDNYTLDFTSDNFEITKATIIGITLKDQTFVYDATAKSLSITGMLPTGASVNYTGNNKVNAGTYTVTAHLNGGNNYNNKDISATLKIEKADISGVTFQNVTVTYDGSLHAVIVDKTTLPSGVLISGYDNNNQTDAGTYTVTAHLNGGNNYNNKDISATLKIEKADISGVTFQNVTVTYDGSLHAVVVNKTTLPSGVLISGYDNNNQTDAGTYTVTAHLDGGNNYNNKDISATLKIEKASQIIHFGALQALTLENASNFQLTATSSVGLPVTYTYSYDGNNPAADVSTSGFVTLHHSGKITITASQTGNKNYIAADPVEQILQINSKDASIHEIVIDGNIIHDPEQVIHFTEDCGAVKNKIAVEINTEYGAEVNPAHQFTVATPKPGIYKKEITIQSQNSINTRTYTIIIERPFAFDDIVVQKFNNTLLVNNNPETNGGYEFVKYQWYKNGQPIAQGQVYSAGDSRNDLLEDGAEYSVALTTKDGDVIHTCAKTISLARKMGISVYPNPVARASGVQVEIAYPQKDFPGAIAEIYALSGQHVMTIRLRSRTQRVHLPATMTAGIYIIVVNIDGHKETTKFMVKP